MKKFQEAKETGASKEELREMTYKLVKHEKSDTKKVMEFISHINDAEYFRGNWIKLENVNMDEKNWTEKEEKKY